MNLLVPGGAGFIGSNFCRYWITQYPADRLVIFDVLRHGATLASLSPILGHPSVTFVKGDIRDRGLVSQVFAREAIDCVVNFAAETHVDRSIADPEPFVATNVAGTHNLLSCCREHWIEKGGSGARYARFHQVSTDEVFGSLEPGSDAFRECDPYSPTSPYSATKAAADHLVRAYHRTYGLPITITTCSNNYGPFQLPDKLIPRVLINALRGQQLPVYGTGANIRDWLHVLDHCRALDRVVHEGDIGQTYNIGGHCERRNIDVVRDICSVLAERFRTSPALRDRFPECPCGQGESALSLITHVADRPGHDFRYALDYAKARTRLGFSPLYDWQAGIAQTVDWYLANEDWWRPLSGLRHLPNS